MLRSLRISLAVKPEVRPELSDVMVSARSDSWYVSHSALNAFTAPRENCTHFLGKVHQHVRRFVLQGVSGKAISNADGEQTGIASGAHVNVRIPDNGCLLGA